MLQLIIAFAVARVIAGLMIIAFFSRDSVAWGYEVTLIVAVCVAVCLLVALAVRRWAPPHPR